MAKNTIIGRVAVKVLPDTSDFRRDAQRKLNQEERRLKFTVPTTIDMSGASREYLVELRKINQRNRMADSRKIRFHTTVSTDGMREAISNAVRQLNDRAKSQKVKIQADLVAAMAKVELDQDSLDQVRDELERFRKRNSPLKISVSPNMVAGSGTVVAARLRVLSRPRMVPLIPYVSKTAAAKAGAALAALSGARVINKYYHDIADAIQRLDKSIPTIGMLSLATAGLSGFALTAVSNVAALAYSIGTIGPAALALPGIFTGMAIGLGVSFVALKDFGAIFPEFVAGLHGLQEAMSTNFWSIAEGGFRRFIDTIFPQFSAGILAVSTQLGGFFGRFAHFLTLELDGKLAFMFENLRRSIEIAASGTDNFASIIETLGTIGSSYLPRLAQWFVDISTQFDAFLSAAAADGRLQQWIDTGIVALIDFGRVLGNAASILTGIGRAAAEAGGSTLAILADTLGRIADIVNSPPFQTMLTRVFLAAHQAMSLIADISGPAVTSFFIALGELLTQILPAAGLAIGTLLASVAAALSQPAFTGGIIALFDGISSALMSLAPAFVPVGAAIGALAVLIGVFLETLGPLLAVFFTALSASFINLAPAITPLIPLLGEALTAAFTALAEVMPMVTEALIVLISGGLIPALTAAIAALLPAIIQLAPIIGQALVTALLAITPLLPQLAEMFAALVPVLVDLVAMILPPLVAILPVLVQAFTALLGAVTPLIPIIGAALVSALNVLTPILPQLAEMFTEIVTVVAEMAAQILPQLIPLLPVMAAAFMQILTAVLPLIPVLLDLVTSILLPLIPVIAQLVTTLLPPLAAAFAALFPAVAPLIAGIGKLVDLLMPILVPALKFVAVILIGALTMAIEGVVQLIEGFVQVLRGAADFLIGVFTGNWRLAWDGIKSIFTGVWDMIVGAFKVFINVGILGIAGKGIAAVKGLFKGGWDNIAGAAGAFFQSLKTRWRQLLNDLKTAPRAALNSIKAFFAGIWDDITRITDLLWQTLPRIFQAGIAAVVGFVKGLPGKAKAAMDDIVSKLTGVATKLWDDVTRIFTTKITSLVSKVREFPGQAKGAMDSIVSKLTGVAKMAWGDVLRVFVAKIAEVVGKVRGLPGKAQAALSNLGSKLTGAGRKLIQGFIDGVVAMFGNVKDTLAGLTKKLTDWKGPATRDRVLLVGAGQLLIEGLIEGLESRYADVRRSLSGMTAEIGGTVIDPPKVGKLSVPEGNAVSRIAAARADAATGAASVGQKVFQYYAAPGASISSEEDLFTAMSRARAVGW